MPGLLWLVVGVCLAGAVQDMLVLAASVRCGGKSLAAIARSELGRTAGGVVSAAILFIVIIALAGLGFVVVKALGGEEVNFAAKTIVTVPAGGQLQKVEETWNGPVYQLGVTGRPLTRPVPTRPLPTLDGGGRVVPSLG
jgi:carbon starvation protein